MGSTTYETATAAAAVDVVERVNGPAHAPAPRGLLSVASVNDDGSARWDNSGALYESLGDFPAITSRTVANGVFNSTTTITSATIAFVAGDVGAHVTGTGVPLNTYIASVTNGTTAVLSKATTATGSGRTFTLSERSDKGIVKMDSSVFCVSPPIGAAGGMTFARAQAYNAWTRIACTGPLSDTPAIAEALYAVREERLLESILASIASELTPATVGTDLSLGLATVERSFAVKHVGQGTVWLDFETINKMVTAGLLVQSGNSLFTPYGNRVSTSPVYTTDIVVTPNLQILRSPLDTLDQFNRATNMEDALVQRQYLFTIDPLTDMVAGNFA